MRVVIRKNLVAFRYANKTACLINDLVTNTLKPKLSTSVNGLLRQNSINLHICKYSNVFAPGMLLVS